MSNVGEQAAIVTAQSSASSGTDSLSSLVDLCRDVVVSNLERFPPPAFAILDELEWETIIKLRVKKTTPKQGRRIAPAVTDKFLSEVEENIPHLAESEVADNLVWKDCVGYKFKEGGQARPRGLLYPWPLLVGRLQRSGSVLVEVVRKSEPLSKEDKKLVRDAINSLCETPMSVRLLEASGVGKSVNKFLKSLTPQAENFLGLNQVSTLGPNKSNRTPKENLTTALETWKSIAASGGVKMKHHGDHPSPEPKQLRNEKVELAESCQTWRRLFVTLKELSERFRENQGAKMRERRERLDKVRPKIVKVRPSNTRHESILSRSSNRFGNPSSASTTLSPSKSKIQQIRMEAHVTSSRRSAPPPQLKATAGSDRGGFSNAVAFASSGSNSHTKRKSTTTVALAAGKRMKVPDAKRAGQNLKKRMGLLKNKGTPKR